MCSIFCRFRALWTTWFHPLERRSLLRSNISNGKVPPSRPHGLEMRSSWSCLSKWSMTNLGYPFQTAQGISNPIFVPLEDATHPQWWRWPLHNLGTKVEFPGKEKLWTFDNLQTILATSWNGGSSTQDRKVSDLEVIWGFLVGSFGGAHKNLTFNFYINLTRRVFYLGSRKIKKIPTDSQTSGFPIWNTSQLNIKSSQQQIRV